MNPKVKQFLGKSSKQDDWKPATWNPGPTAPDTRTAAPKPAGRMVASPAQQEMDNRARQNSDVGYNNG